MNKRILILVFAFAVISISVYGQKNSRDYIDSFLSELPKMKEDSTGVMLLNNTSFAYSKIKPDSGMWYAQLGLALAQKVGWKKGEAQAYRDMGNCYSNRSDYAQALDNYYKGLSIDEDIHNAKEVSIVLGNISLVYLSLGKYDKALENQLKALELTAKTDKTGLEYLLGNIGITYSLQNRYGEAQKYHRLALKTAEELNDKAVIVMELTNISNTFKATKDYAAAIRFASQALKMAYAFDRTKAIATNLGNMGSLYLCIAKDTLTVKPDSLIPYGKAANTALAISYLAKGITACREIGFRSALQADYQAISEAYTLEGNYKDAMIAYQLYTQIKDSIFSTENNIKITNLETKRAVELKDKQLEIDRLEILKKRNERVFFVAGIMLMLGIIIIIFRNYRIQKSTNQLLYKEKKKVEERTDELTATLQHLRTTQDQLVETEKQKENEQIRSRIAMDIHDDVSSELTRLSWLSELAKLKFKQADTAEASVLLDKITASSRHTIGNLKEIIWTVKPENDTLENLAAYMRNYISVFFTDTRFEYHIDFPDRVPAIPINPELKRNLFLVIKEALNNAVKYSGASHIDVIFAITNSQQYYSFTIKDNGKGIDENVVHGGGNGLKNMRRRMEAVQGACTIVTQPGNGTTILFEGKLY